MSSPRMVTLVLVVLDAAAVVVSFNLVAWARGLIEIEDPIIAALQLPVAIHFLGVYLVDGYSRRTDMLSVTYASLHLIAQTGVLLVTMLLTFVFIPSGFQLQSSRLVTGVSYLLVIPLSLAYRRLLYQRVRSRQQQRQLLFLGPQGTHASFAEECRRNQVKQNLVFMTPGAPPQPAGEAAARDEIVHFLDQFSGRIDAIVLHDSRSQLPPALAQRLAELNFSGVPTYPLELFHQVYWRKIPLDELNQHWLFQAGFQIAREPVFARLKRLSDIAFSVTGLALFVPVFPLVAFAIWVTDRGPILFQQPRVGRNRVVFNVYKLRTMRLHDSGERYTRPDDDRITAVGRFLRATRLDEVPQLWNVLRNDMSLIGPRAEWVKLVEEYEQKIPCYHFRHLVKPGITGWAQINYPYGANLEDTRCKLEYDLYYIRFFSFVLDASIVLKTIHVMLFGKGR